MRGLDLDAFVVAMSYELNVNAWKGKDPAVDFPLRHHRRELPYHVTKLLQAVSADDKVRILEHAADVANDALILATAAQAMNPEVFKRRSDEDGVIRLPLMRRLYALMRHPVVWWDKLSMRMYRRTP